MEAMKFYESMNYFATNHATVIKMLLLILFISQIKNGESSNEFLDGVIQSVHSKKQ